MATVNETAARRPTRHAGTKPTYYSEEPFRSAGKLCTACGAIIGNVRGDDQIHTQWHQALAALLAPE